MSAKGIFALVAAAFVAVLLYGSIYVVYPSEQAIVTQFGRIERATRDAGFYFKVPFIQSVEYLDKRARYLEQSEREVIASDKKRLIIDSFVRYRIVDPLVFKRQAKFLSNFENQLNGFMGSSLRDVVADFGFREIVRDKRDELVELIRKSVNEKTMRLGVEVVDYRIRRADLPEENSAAVYRQMQTERQQEANGIRADGEKLAQQIRSVADRNATVIVANARRDSEITRGEGDAQRNNIFAQAYGKNPSFFEFYRSMQAYERSLANGDTRLVLSPTGEFFGYFSGADDPNPGAVPAATGPISDPSVEDASAPARVEIPETVAPANPDEPVAAE
ncbi:membrane protease subunit HflC [Cohaesibacter sp. ES.047]|uniref:protease modulator HflC n=1 Tax=Cohaesibacter sp. ES.047 TaxID=1798205 RepID=UPI000BB6D3E8|nr:protease modulator HflC [Cohaesibacter sp. ES.047]SNY94336.1 membrane protease subunit HflC [Cohaesibacter sp. ES.047]